MPVLAACDVNSMINAGKCFDCLSATVKQRLQVWFLAQALKSFGGADLTNLNTLYKTVACMDCIPNFRQDSVLTAVYQKLAAAAGANVDLPIAQLRAKVPCAGCDSPSLSETAELYLLCSLALIGR